MMREKAVAAELNSGKKYIVAVSGGIDSAVLLHFLAQGAFESSFLPVHVDFGQEASEHVKSLSAGHGLDTVVLTCPDMRASGCYACARERKKRLFSYAEEVQAAGVITGHHGDDVIESFFISLFYGSEIHTFPPVSLFFDGKIRVVRPFYRLFKEDIQDYARRVGLSGHAAVCGSGIDNVREKVRAFTGGLADDVKCNVLKAVSKGQCHEILYR